MCGRFALRRPEVIAEHFGLTQLPLFDGKAPLPRYNIAPGQRALVVLEDGAGRRAEWMTWGLVPSWSRQPRSDYSTINARAEGIATKATFRGPLRSQRCIVPADGFYEWQPVGKHKQPYFIHLDDDRIFGFAGLYDRSRDPDGGEMATFTIVTTEANEVIRSLHPRMAVMLRPDEEALWLDPHVTESARVLPLLHPYAGDDLATYPISSLVNAAGNEGPALIASLASDEPPDSAPRLF
jgi:putative SOS response-associated peptidase YedK